MQVPPIENQPQLLEVNQSGDQAVVPAVNQSDVQAVIPPGSSHDVQAVVAAVEEMEQVSHITFESSSPLGSSHHVQVVPHDSELVPPPPTVLPPI